MGTLKLHLCEFAGNGDTYLHKQAPKILESSLLLARHSVRPVSTKPDGFGGPPNLKKLACLWSHRTGVRTTRNSSYHGCKPRWLSGAPPCNHYEKPLDSSWRVGQMLSRWFCVLLPCCERLYFPTTSVVLCLFDTYMCMYVYIYIYILQIYYIYVSLVFLVVGQDLLNISTINVWTIYPRLIAPENRLGWYPPWFQDEYPLMMATYQKK